MGVEIELAKETVRALLGNGGSFYEGVGRNATDVKALLVTDSSVPGTASTGLNQG